MDIHKQSLYTQKTPHGIGVFSRVSFPANYRLFEFTGDVLTTEQLKTRHPSDVVDFLQIGIDLWKSKSGTFDDYFAHSCNPNAYVRIVGQRAILTSLYAIQPNMEITFDWSTTSTETKNEWMMYCKCGYVFCRKVISGFQYLPASLQKEYKSKDILPKYILPYVVES